MALELLDSDERITVQDTDLGLKDGDPEVSYTLRVLSVREYRRIVKEHTKQVLNRRTHQREDDVDVEAASDAVWNYVLVGWTGITFRGQPVPCDGEFKYGIDPVRRNLLLDLAGMNRVRSAKDDRDASFRGAA